MSEADGASGSSAVNTENAQKYKEPKQNKRSRTSTMEETSDRSYGIFETSVSENEEDSDSYETTVSSLSESEDQFNAVNKAVDETPVKNKGGENTNTRTLQQISSETTENEPSVEDFTSEGKKENEITTDLAADSACATIVDTDADLEEMTTSLPAAVLLSGLPEEEQDEILNLKDQERLLMGLMKPPKRWVTSPCISKSCQGDPWANSPKLSKGNKNSVKLITRQTLFDSNYYVNIADTLENAFVNLNDLVANKDNHVPEKSEPVSLSEGLSKKCQESLTHNADKLHYAWSVINQVESMYQEKYGTSRFTEEEKDIEVTYQNRDILDLGNNINPFQPFSSAEIPSGATSFFENRAVLGRLDGNPIPNHVMAPCCVNDCFFQEPKY